MSANKMFISLISISTILLCITIYISKFPSKEINDNVVKIESNSECGVKKLNNDSVFSNKQTNLKKYFYAAQ